MSQSVPAQPRQVIVAGGGVAALEGALALAAFAPGHVQVTLLSASTEYAVRALAVQEPFAAPPGPAYPIDAILGRGAAHVVDDLDHVDPESRTVVTRGGRRLPYDALLIATGARPSVRFPHAITLDDRKLGPLLREMFRDVHAHVIRCVAFVVPDSVGWPLPLYELALLTRHRAQAAGIDLRAVIVTPEDRPLQLFGADASRGVAALLHEADIDVLTSAQAEVPQRREVVINPGERRLSVDRVVALPELLGPAIVGLPQDADGFLPVDAYGQVDGAGPVYAAGDVTNLPIKHGGVAAQQAVVAARAIAAAAGAHVARETLDPVLRGILLTGEQPRYLSAHRVGGHGFESTFSSEPSWDPPVKVSTRFLAPRLAELDAAASLAASVRAAPGVRAAARG